MSSSAIIDTVEAAYRLDGDETSWLARLCDAVTPAFPHLDLPLVAMTATANATDGLRLRAVIGPHSKEEVESKNRELPTNLFLGAATVCASAREVLVLRGCDPNEMPVFGDIVDQFAVGATSPDGTLVYLVSLCRTPPGACAPVVRERWSRVTSHFLAGLRLRDRVARAAAGEEAILDPNGKTLHAEGDARSKSLREVLRGAVRNVDRARSRRGRRDADEALAIWQGLVAGRWSLVDRFESDGRRYIVARRNEPALDDPRGLSKREKQVVAYVARGYSDKETAYVLGLERSTVATHLATAMRKLGIVSRVELAQALYEHPMK
jgi:DNA-binding CsgD family transcriptional regulator